MQENFKSKLKIVRNFIFDVDGVLTDGNLFVMNGELHRTMNIRDGYALKTAVENGFRVIIISGGKSESVRQRLNGLGITEVHLGVNDKVARLNEINLSNNINLDETIYMGDDLPDYEVMKICGIPCCPEDAAPEIRGLCMYISPFKGGSGCVRDIIEQVLRCQGKWPYAG
ncbi:MAG: 3-deoxy-D-manno-octulosonate 8-phosphate phosphatase [Bacteroidetes bacterium]|nr:MAG: 3-deoxy-D-manno-octulosonate 8-phosphate phosphatase [Bacteroidota bacterium]REK08055.1 MAG: 3-deoxy-D-manno-octulosonate 8-phosphate phosphatase [Bacteroidota bacterium]REK32260.1 MAG: 3-deoxy-D-manno-octulosonate 8-phosphate phosphatase [Bacteroidota bacterium]REK47412.1 MAG: 3-deoxy-D-manno-octulosonate 8-phosphate phosphatase [Bacteroidota bacterium]